MIYSRNNNTKKIVAALMAAVMMIGMAGCKDDNNKSRKHKKEKEEKIEIDIKELQEHEGPMLTISVIPCGEMTMEEYENYSYEFGVTYEGDAYIPNPVYESGYSYLKMTDEDYEEIYRFCIESVANDTFKGYYEDVCDGTQYRFTFYDTDGEAHLIYSGYCYQNDDLQHIMDIIGMYCID